MQNQRPPSAPSKADYPPPAHNSRVNTSKSSEKLTVPTNHVNVFGYPAYQPTAFFPHEPKNKNDHHKAPPTSGMIVAKSNASVEREREGLPNPPPLMSELKNSVIVKHDGKNPHLLEPRVSSAHSQSPKLRVQDMMSHYVVPTSTPTHKTNLYEYRSPTQSPHHLAHTPSPHHHLEPQNLGKVSHHRTTGQIPSPHHQRQSPHHPHSQQHPSPELRYRTSSESQAMIFPSSGKTSYPYIASTASMAHYSVATGTVSNAKPKVSSPAPHHIYGKPPVMGPGITVTRPMEAVSASNPIPLTSKPPLTSSVSPSPYQQVSHYNVPHPQATPMTNCLPPPPAHTNRTSSTLGPGMYDRIYAGGSVPGSLSVKPSVQLGTSPPSAASAPTSISRSHNQYNTTQNLTASSVQTQPLDLGVSSNKYDSAVSPKRKGTPVSFGSNGPVCLEKKRKLDSPSQQQQQQASVPPLYASQQPQLARVSEPSPLIASAATTITTVVNTAAYTPPGSLINTQTVSESLPDVSVTPVTVPLEPARPPSTEEAQIPIAITTATVITPSSTPTPANTVAEASPATPAKSVTPSVVDSEKSNSPGPTKSTSYPVRHLKKAWLQRHTGEDLEDTTGVTGSGSCVTLPLNINTPAPAKESPVTSLHNIGSMAVNSINKPKHLSAKANNRKGNHKNSSSINGHQTDLTKGDDSSSSDQERGRKSPPKRKPPKVKRKKGGGPTKKVSEEQKRRKVGNQSVAASESGSESDKESGSEKDSDSGASTTLTTTTTTTTTKKPNSSTTVNNKDKEPRKRGRRPKTSKNDKGEEPRPKKSKEESPLPQRDPFRKPPVGQLKKTGESFLQDGPCFEVAPKLGKCRECRWTPNQRTKNMPNIFCRFYAFRRLRYTKNGQLAIAGFSDPNKDALEVSLFFHYKLTPF